MWLPFTTFKTDNLVPGSMAVFNSKRGEIAIDLDGVKKYGKSRWRRMLIVVWAHEFIHLLQDILLSPLLTRSGYVLKNLYREEVRCGYVTYIVESILRVPHVWPTPYDSALYSTHLVVLSQFCKTESVSPDDYQMLLMDVVSVNNLAKKLGVRPLSKKTMRPARGDHA